MYVALDICILPACEVLSILDAVLTVSPKRQYRGILLPTMPEQMLPVWAPTRISQGFPFGIFAKQTGADCLALDDSVSADWIARNVQADGCVQGNLASSHMVSGGKELIKETKKIVKALSNGPHIFNLGHGITPDADPNNVQIMIDAIRETN